MAIILDGKKIAQKIENKVKNKVSSLKIKPKLTVIRVGDDPGSEVYVQMKKLACEKVGIGFEEVRINDEQSLKECANENFCSLAREIERLNNDFSVTGILVQLPLPDKVSPRKIVSTIDPKKDVDCLHPLNIGRLSLGVAKLAPATPKGCLALIKETGKEISGQNAVVVGRSDIVGKPMAQLLLQEDATVTICHSKTKYLKEFTQRADILISAAGRPKTITKDMVKKGAIVIDVGISREEKVKEEVGGTKNSFDDKTTKTKRLTGDVDFEQVQDIAGYITPVPGGVGPMTIAMLLENILVSNKLQE